MSMRSIETYLIPLPAQQLSDENHAAILRHKTDITASLP